MGLRKRRGVNPLSFFAYLAPVPRRLFRSDISIEVTANYSFRCFQNSIPHNLSNLVTYAVTNETLPQIPAQVSCLFLTGLAAAQVVHYLRVTKAQYVVMKSDGDMSAALHDYSLELLTREGSFTFIIAKHKHGPIYLGPKKSHVF